MGNVRVSLSLRTEARIDVLTWNNKDKGQNRAVENVGCCIKYSHPNVEDH